VARWETAANQRKKNVEEDDAEKTLRGVCRKEDVVRGRNLVDSTEEEVDRPVDWECAKIRSKPRRLVVKLAAVAKFLWRLTVPVA